MMPLGRLDVLEVDIDGKRYVGLPKNPLEPGLSSSANRNRPVSSVGSSSKDVERGFYEPCERVADRHTYCVKEDVRQAVPQRFPPELDPPLCKPRGEDDDLDGLPDD